MGVGVFCAEKRGWAERENAFFILEIFRATHRAGLGGGYIPRRWRPQPTAHPERLHITGSSADHTRHGTQPGRWTRCTGLHSIPDRPRGVDQGGGGRWRIGNSSIMRIVIALSQAWYIDSNMNKYHKDILLFLVIVNYYLSIDIPFY